ncbi:MAG: acyltransferase [Microbacteriaceae bacterium]|nr:acyltransferase [Microbacteriaceae bacterium]
MTAPVLKPLTGIRFVAAIFVFNAHANNLPGGPEFLDGVALAGHDWMTMFFILSGLVLTWNYDEVLGTRLTGAGLRTYYVARLARIYPLYLLVLAVVAVSAVEVPAQLGELLRNPTLWTHVLAVQTWSGDLAVAYGFNGPGWSVGVELFLYALLPLLIIPFRAIRSRPRALIAVAIACILLTFAFVIAAYLLGTADLPREDPASAHRWLYRTPLTRLPDFVLGMSLGYLLLHTRGRDLVRTGRVLQVVGGVAVAGLMVAPGLPFTIWSLDAANTAPFAALMLGLVWAPDTAFARFLSSGPMMLLGESAYAFYLWHQTIVHVVAGPATTTTAWVITWVVAFLITTLVAVGSHLLVEQPARAFLRRRLAGQGPPATAVARP